MLLQAVSPDGDLICGAAFLRRSRLFSRPFPARKVLLLQFTASSPIKVHSPGHAALHDMMVKREFHFGAAGIRAPAPREPITQKHDIEGLVMG